jgi:hypothetical protein
MDADPLPELAALRALVETADLPGDARKTALWCIGQFPRHYHELLRTQEQRFADAIQGLAQALLKHFFEHGGASVADALLTQLQALHERLGLRPLSLKPAAGRRRKTA